MNFWDILRGFVQYKQLYANYTSGNNTCWDASLHHHRVSLFWLRCFKNSTSLPNKCLWTYKGVQSIRLLPLLNENWLNCKSCAILLHFVGACSVQLGSKLSCDVSPFHFGKKETTNYKAIASKSVHQQKMKWHQNGRNAKQAIDFCIANLHNTWSEMITSWGAPFPAAVWGGCGFESAYTQNI